MRAKTTSSWLTNRVSSKKVGSSIVRRYSSVVRRYDSAKMLSWSHAVASGSKRRRISRITASTQRVRPALQSFALEGSYPVVKPGSSSGQPMYGGSWAWAVAGANASAARRQTVTRSRAISMLEYCAKRARSKRLSDVR